MPDAIAAPPSPPWLHSLATMLSSALNRSLWSRRAVPSPLYHYTDGSGLEGILKDRVIWASHHRYLNDSMEGIYTAKLVDDLLRAPALDLRLPEASSIAGEWGRALRTTLLLHPPGPELATPFVACLSEAPDSLSQWRAYGNDGLGFAVGFDSLEFGDTDNRVLEAAVYDEKVQKAIVNETLSAASAHLAVVFPSVRGTKEMAQIAEETADVLASAFTTMSAFFKHPGFHEEKEWRFIVMVANGTVIPPRDSNPVVDVRVARGRLTPYLKIPLPSPLGLSLQRVVVGPGHHWPDARLGVELLLRKHSVDPSHVDIVHAGVPYRA